MFYFKNIIFLKIQNAKQFENEAQIFDYINLELTKQTVNTILDGLTKIKDQLNSVAVK